MLFFQARNPDPKPAIVTIEATRAWRSIKQIFQQASRDDYLKVVRGQCRIAVSTLLEECPRKKLFIPVYPEGAGHIDAFHSYGLAGPRLSREPADDIIIDPTIGQIVPTWAPYIGSRNKLKLDLKQAFSEGLLNPEFIGYFSRQMALKGEQVINADLLFKTYYGDNSWSALKGRALKR